MGTLSYNSGMMNGNFEWIRARPDKIAEASVSFPGSGQRFWATLAITYPDPDHSIAEATVYHGGIVECRPGSNCRACRSRREHQDYYARKTTQRERKHMKKKTEKATEGNELRPEYDCLN